MCVKPRVLRQGLWDAQEGFREGLHPQLGASLGLLGRVIPQVCSRRYLCRCSHEQQAVSAPTMAAV